MKKSKLAFVSVGLFIFFYVPVCWAQKSTVGIMDLATREGFSDTEALTLTDYLYDTVHKLADQSDFRLAAKNVRDSLFEEQKFVLSGVAENDAIRIGRMLGVELMIFGFVSQFSNTYSLTLMLVDVSTSEVLGSSSKKTDNRNEIPVLLDTCVYEIFKIDPPDLPDKEKMALLPKPRIATPSEPREPLLTVPASSIITLAGLGGTVAYSFLWVDYAEGGAIIHAKNLAVSVILTASSVFLLITGIGGLLGSIG
jgi:hypothetical protein